MSLTLFGIAGLTLLPVLGCSVVNDQSAKVRVDTQTANVQSLPGAGRPVPGLQEVAWS